MPRAPASTLKVPVGSQAQCDDLHPSDQPDCRITLLGRSAPHAGFVILRQTFVLLCHGGIALLRRGGHLSRCSLSWVGAGQVWAVTFVAPIKTKKLPLCPLCGTCHSAPKICPLQPHGELTRQFERRTVDC